MLKLKEFVFVIAIALILAFSFTVASGFENFLFILLSFLAIIFINVFAKKIAAFFLESEIEIRIWEISRYGFKPHRRFKRNVPLGAILPIVISALSIGLVQWMASLVFDVKAKTYRAAKKHGLYRFSEMTETHIGLIAASGIFANILFAIIGYFIGLPEQMNFVIISIYFIFFNLIPISDLDGNKIFFGNIVLWTFFATISLISLIGIFMVV